MKKYALLLSGLILSLSCLAGGIKSGPWVTEARDTGVTVLWISDVPGKAYVELSDSTKIWDTFAGRRIFRSLHCVRIDGLKPGSVINYRVCGIDIKDDTNARDPEFGQAYEGSWHSVRTFDPKAPECRFSVFNDIHMHTRKYSALAGQLDSASTDFLFLNGDIVSAGNYSVDSLARCEIDPLGELPAGIPVLFARGNHEGRGNGVENVAKVFPNSDPAPFYYSFRHGPAAFVVLDAGETGKKRSVRYSGTAVYEEYLGQQIEWLKKAVREPSFRSAPVKICLIHVPMIDHPDQNDFLTQRWLNKHIVPLLNKAGLTLMIGADLHEFMYCEPGSMGNKFPIMVNDDLRRLECTCTRKETVLRTFNADGALEFEKKL